MALLTSFAMLFAISFAGDPASGAARGDASDIGASEAQAVNDAAQGLFAQIEDDTNPDTYLVAIRAESCLVTIEGEERSWQFDWRTIEGVMMGDPSFIFIAAPSGSLAIVTDGEQPAQLDRIARLAAAMAALQDSCRT